jgi:hypothetical protein
MTGTFGNGNTSSKRELSKSALGTNNMLDQMDDDNMKKQSEPVNTKSRMNYMSKLGIPSNLLIFIN